MQISRHWRIKPQRYRLEGVRYQNGDMSLQHRPLVQNELPRNSELDTQETPVVRLPANVR
jgi:hypothetical protein